MRIMKTRHLIIVAAAAMVACTNQEVLTDALRESNSTPSAIGFNSYSEKSTKAGVNDINSLEYFHDSFVVYGNKQSVNNPERIDSVFGRLATGAGTLNGTVCKYKDPDMDANLGDWRYEFPRYWDRQAKYWFIAYAPASANNPIRLLYHEAKALVGNSNNKFVTESPYVLAGTNIQATPTESEKLKGFTTQNGGDLDLMVSNAVYELGSNHDSYNNTNNSVHFIFRHILSKLNVTIDKTEAVDKSIVTLKEIRIEGLKDCGTYDSKKYVSNADTVINGWTASYSQVPSTYTITFTGSKALNNGNKPVDGPHQKGTPIYFIESLIMPQQITADDNVKMYLSYSIKENKEGAPEQAFNDQEIDFSDITEFNNEFLEGYNYTLRLTIGPDLIMLTPEMSSWTDLATDQRIGDL